MNYDKPETIIESGVQAYKDGIARNDHPISHRTGMNAISWWQDGWDQGKEQSCKGRNCRAFKGVGHSEECEHDHDALFRY